MVLSVVSHKVTAEMNISLLAPFSDDEIKIALFQMHLTNAPGPDGMTLEFYQKHWPIVGHDICEGVRSLLSSRNMMRKINFTHVTLIPKKSDPTSMTQLRPISLCNVIYKICSKVLTNMLKMFLPNIISPSQSVLISGRLISDNCLVASEIAHAMKKKNSGWNGVMALKLDINRAYDRLSALLDVWEAKERIQGIKICNGAPSTYHLLFADDSFIFARSFLQECCELNELLKCYERASGQAGNLGKSSVAFSANVHEFDAQLLDDCLGMKQVEYHDRYPGLPVLTSKSKKATFTYIKDRLWKKLNGWRGSLLSSARKEILIKAVA
ncbi:uncharacterized protein LOC126602671 [Malus sylvestris]|uniref:uncharacterized protein LOC126602671 n=1 Tax=Malus sylvestris TaxID=3752 RepID=UPI0021ACA339|nr:uncharacterized protein LOC126602671 [Malus sylvestris]